MPDSVQSCRRDIPRLKMCFNCTNNLMSDHTNVIRENHFIWALNLAESVHNITLHLNHNLFFYYLFSVPSQAAALWLCFHILLPPQQAALTLFTYSSGRQAQSPLKGKKCSSMNQQRTRIWFFLWITIYISVHLNFN